MRKSTRFGAALLGVLLVVSACSGDGESDAAGGRDRITLSYAIWDNSQRPVMDELGREFTRTHPDVTIDVQLAPWTDYWTRLRAAAGGGAAPDVFWMNGPNFRLYASNGMLRSLEKEIARDGVDLSVYPRPLVDLYTLNGERFGLPKDMDTIGVWYNKALFDAKDVAHPADDWTWADFQSAAARLTDPAAGVYGTAAMLGSFQECQYNTIAQAGGHVISPDGRRSGYDDPRTIAGLRFWTDLIRAGRSPDLMSMTDTVPLQLFEVGKIAMYWGGSWNVAEFSANAYTRGRVDVAPLPRGERRATVIHGVANVVSATTGHPEEAWQFVRFLGSRQAADILGRKGPMPAHTGTQDAWVSAHPEFDLRTFVDAVAYGVPYPVSANTAAWNESELTHLARAWTGEV
ncbi:ABC transporter substrate-binding protein, partial [Streptosporangium lutulentum]